MSYILDALRKSEQQRQHGVAPRLLAVHAASAANTQPAFLKYGLIAVVLISAGVVIGGLQPWQQAQRLSATESTSAKMLEPRSRQSIAASLPGLPEIARESGLEAPVQESLVAVKKPASAPAPEATVEPDRDFLARTPVPTPKLPPKSAALSKETATPFREATTPTQEAAVPPLQEKSADAAATGTAQEQKVISMAELPPAIQQEIPAMSIPVHTYSDTPKERVVGINDRLLQEGDYLAPGLKLEQIAPDGVIFSYRHYLFRHGL